MAERPAADAMTVAAAAAGFIPLDFTRRNISVILE
jgi:hypothetical protein